MKYQTEICRENSAEEEVIITVQADAYAGTKNYFDKEYGNWLPGDDPSIEILSAIDEQGLNIDLTKDEELEVFEAAENAEKEMMERD